MDQDIKEEFKKADGQFAKNNEQFAKIDENFAKINANIEKMSQFMMTHVALKIDLQDMATKDDLQTLKSDIISKVDGIAYHYKKLEDEKVVTERRIGALEQKLGIV